MSGTPFMPLWVGDFLLKTGDLDARETGAYLLLLMAMWSRDGSLPSDQKKLQRVAKCGREWPAVWGAIGHYFNEEDGRITNPRLTEELQKARAKREVNQHNGGRGGRAKALKNKEPHLANAVAKSCQSYSESEREEEIGKPISRPKAENLTTCIDHFNAVAGRVGWSQVQRLTPTRQAALSHRIADCGGQEAWRDAIDRAALSPLLTGQTGRGWRADFDWLCKAENFTKLMEGNYDPRPDNPRTAHQRGPGGPHDSMVAAFAHVAGREPH